ncbi:MAG: SDR family NAD(P)-dependent oxidoreductase [Acaryochloris sp. CRU_2_0]|nr:SDR family NAD(P)-dependent oxidoreductase [Acaryochloris sp. CRU_2_0]
MSTGLTERYVARLEPHLSPPCQTVQPDEAGSYLITGGLGGLGLQVAQWLAEQKVKQLVLIGRQIDRPETQVILTTLEQTGTRVTVMAADVTSQTDMAQVLDKIQTSLPPLKGIIHTAGVLEDSILLNQDWDQFTQVMAPKVQGTWILHTLTQALPLDFFICFSSISALIGAPGQGNYAAANAFMDSFATYRQTLGLSGLSLNWGPWAQQGMAARLASDYQNRIMTAGFKPFSDIQGVQLLSQVLQQQQQIGIVSVDWTAWSNQVSGRRRAYFTTVLPKGWGRTSNPIPWADQQSSIQHQEVPTLSPLPILQTIAVAERQSFLINYFTQEIGQALLLTPEQVDQHESLTFMGFDSLMALELRNRLRTNLGVEIPVARLIEGISIQALATEVCEQLAQILEQSQDRHPSKTAEKQGSSLAGAVSAVSAVSSHEWFSEGEL